MEQLAGGLVQADLLPTMMPPTTTWNQMALESHHPQMLQMNQDPLVKTYPLTQLQESPQAYPNSHMHLYQVFLHERVATFSTFSSCRPPELANETAMVVLAVAAFLVLLILLLPLD